MMLSALLTALVAGTGPAMVGPPVAVLKGGSTYETTLLTSIGTECACSDLTMSGGEAVTTTRASTAYCTASDGTMTSCAVNKPRVSSTGLLVEGTRTNIVLRSQEFDHATWTAEGLNGAAAPVVTANAGVAPDGTTTAERIVFGAVSGVNEASNVFQPINVTAVAHSLGQWLKTESGTATLYLSATNGSGTWHSATCSITTTWSRCLNQNKTLTATTWYYTLGVDLSDAGQTAKGEQTVLAWNGQMEAASFLTSDIATEGTAVARSSETVSFTPTQSIASEGCFAASVTPIAPFFPQRIASSAGGFTFAFNSTASIHINDGTNTKNSSAVANMTGRTVVARGQWAGSAMRPDLDGVTGTDGTFDGSMGAGAFYLGTNNGVQHLFGHLKNIELGTSSGGCQ